MRILPLGAGLLAGALCLPAALSAQHSLAMHNHSGTSSAASCDLAAFDLPIADPFAKEQGVTLVHPVSSDDAKAKAYFNLGLTFYYGFDNTAAMWAFHQASLADSGLAMAYWGVALAAGGDLNIPIDSPCLKVAQQQIALARDKAGARPTSDADKAYVAALSVRYDTSQTTDTRKLNERYAAAMEELYGKWGGQDPDAGALYAYSLMNLHPWEWWTKPDRCPGVQQECRPGQPGCPAKEIEKVLPALEKGLGQWKDHIGLNHINIHAREEAPIPEAVEAQVSADFLHQGGAPKITPHLSHMPAHTYLLLGDWQRVVGANREAVARDGQWLAACAKPGNKQCNQLLVGHYYSHDLLFLTVGLANWGQWPEVAEKSTLLENNALEFLSTQPGLEHYITTKVMMMVHFGKWQELTTLGPPAPLRVDSCDQMPFDKKLALAMWYFGQGMAKTSVVPRQNNDEERKTFARIQQCVRDARVGWGNNLAADVLEVVRWRLEERTFRTAGQWQQAKEAALKAVAAEDALQYDEPPGWYLSSRENLGGVLYGLKEYDAALDTFAADLCRRPNNSRSLFGIWQTLKAKPGTPKEQIDAAEKRFRDYWSGAELPKMEDL